MIPLLAKHLSIPQENTIPFEEWVQRVREFPAERREENPAIKLINFLDDHFIRMSCGGLILDTTKSCADSPVLSSESPISPDLVQKYIEAWRGMGFLS